MKIRFLVLLHLLYSIHFVNEYKYINMDFKSYDYKILSNEDIGKNNEKVNKNLFKYLLKNSLCNYEIIDKYKPCLVTILPCGDIDDYDNILFLSRKSNNIKFDYIRVSNYSYKLKKILNQFKNRAEKNIADKINKLHKKYLGNNKFVSTNIQDEINSRNSFNSNEPNITKTKCDYYESSIFDIDNNFLIRKIIKKIVINELKLYHPDIFISNTVIKQTLMNINDNNLKQDSIAKTKSKEIEIINESNIEKYFIKRHISNGIVYIKRKNVSFNHNE
jgi:hypothetical protein